MKKLAVALACIVFTTVANAGIVYDVSDATNTSCGPHGLWTNGTTSGCDRFYSFAAGSTLTLGENANGKARAWLVATAVRGSSVAMIDLTFRRYTANHNKISQLKGTNYGDESTWEFFRRVSGTINIDSTVFEIDELVGGTALQIGQGANDKNAEVGASAWISGPQIQNHWDLNMNLAAQVPEPATILLLGAGLGLLGLRRSKLVA